MDAEARVGCITPSSPGSAASLRRAPGRVPVHEMSLSHGHRAPNRVFVHERSLSHGRRGPSRVFIHEMSLSHGHQAPGRVFIHEMSLYHGHRGPDRVFVHEMSLSHGHQAPGRVFGHHRLSLPASPERPSMTRGSDSSKVEPRKTTSGDLISIIRRSNAQSQLKASTIS